MLSSPKKKIKLVTVGSMYPMEWILSFWNTLVWANTNGYMLDFSFSKGSNIYKLRDSAIGAGSKTVFNGQDYDYILWIDSDQIFNGENLKACIEADKDVVSPMIMTEDGTFSASIMHDKELAEGLRRLTEEDVKGKEPIEVDNLGFGFTLIKKGVYESINWPWHAPVLLANGDYSSEDHAFCKKAKENGFKLWVLPDQKVYHLKTVPL